MAEVYGIQELKDLSTAVAHTAMVIDDVLADNKVDFKDVAKVPQLLGALREFTDVSFQKLMPEIKDISVDEAKDLAAHFSQVFNLTNDKIEGVVETGLTFIIQGLEIFQKLRGMASQIKAAVA